MDYSVFKQWISDNWYFIPLFAGMAVIVFFLLRIQNSLRERTTKQIEHLLAANPALCAERLENNRLFRTIFRKPLLELWKLQAYMQLGSDENIEKTISRLYNMKLEPRDKIEFYQQCLSYYAVVGKKEEAEAARNNLRKFIVKAKAQDTAPYSTMLEEADTIYGVYIEHNTALIKKLTGKAEHTKDDVARGIIQYRIAKLAYFKGDETLMHTYISRASKNLKGTAYETILKEAEQDPSVLAEK